MRKCLLTLIAISLWAGCATAQQATDTLDSDIAPLYEATKEAEAADFRLDDRHGSPYQLSAHKGQVVLLNMWATWCGPCRKEIPDLMKLYADLKDRGLSVVGIALDEQGWSVVRPYARKMKINYPVAVDDGTVRKAYGPFTVVPTTYIIGRQGLIRYYAPGRLNEARLRPALEKLLKEGDEGQGEDQ